jgi:hypothetical protein
MRRDGLPPIFPSCRSCCGTPSRRLPIRRPINKPYVQTGIRRPRRTTRCEHSTPTDAQTILVQ